MIDDTANDGPYFIKEGFVWRRYMGASPYGHVPDPVRVCTTSQNLAAAVDIESGVLHSHGFEDDVKSWIGHARSTFANGGFPELADALVLYVIPVTPETVEELNACASCTGRAHRLAERLATLGDDVGLSAMAPMGRA
jgi:hypothetical protein